MIIQVKTSFSCRSVYLAGHREGVNNNSYYNCAYGPVKAHFIIAVSGKPENPYFYILPIVDAERLCVENHCEWIAGRRRDGGERSQSHQIKVAPEKLEDYKDKWNLLEATRN